MQSGSEFAGRVVIVAGDFSFSDIASPVSVGTTSVVGLISADSFPSAGGSPDSWMGDEGSGGDSGAGLDGVSGGDSFRTAVAPPAIPPAADKPARSRCALHDL